MYWANLGDERSMWAPYSTYYPGTIDFWWHEDDCKIDLPATACTCTTAQRREEPDAPATGTV